MVCYRGRGKQTPFLLGPLLCISERWIYAVRKKLRRIAHHPGKSPGIIFPTGCGPAAREPPPGLPRRLVGAREKKRLLFPWRDREIQLCDSSCLRMKLRHGGSGEAELYFGDNKKETIPRGSEATDPQVRSLGPPPFGTGGM